MPRTHDEINAEIQKIFKAHGIKPKPGEEAFWLGWEQVHQISREDSERLSELADEWTCYQKLSASEVAKDKMAFKKSRETS